MTAQGAGIASNVVPITEHVIGFASERVWYAAGYASANASMVSAGSAPFKKLDGERILVSLGEIRINHKVRIS